MKIFNRVEGHEITINDDEDRVTIMPQHYNEDDPHIKIELNDLDWFTHAESCTDCKAFFNAFGTDTANWHLSWKDKVWPLILKGVGNRTADNRASFQVGEFFSGTKLRLKLDIQTRDELMGELLNSERLEDYEHCIILQRRINARDIT